MGDQFWKLLEQSTIVSGIISLSLTGTACYLWATGQALPQELYISLGLVLGFFFGAKSQKTSYSARNK